MDILQRKKSSGGQPRVKTFLFDPKKIVAVGLDAFRARRGGESALKARQRKRLQNLIAFSRERSPYFRKLYAGLPQGVSELSLLPPTNKQELMENFDGWVSDPEVTKEGVEAHLADKSLVGKPYLGRYLVWTSSGTSGIPAAFVQDGGALAVLTVMSIMRGPGRPRDFLKILLGGGRRAGLYGTGGPLQGAVLMGYLQNKTGWMERFAGFSVLTPLPELVRRLNDFRPAVLGGYASTLTLLAGEQEAGRLRINPVLIVSGGESLSPKAQEVVSAAFGCPARDYYGTSEASGLTMFCEHDRLHVNEDWFILEPVDEDYQPVGPGEISHTVLLTNLANRVQPLIRYDLGDRVALEAERCPCGSPLPVLWVEGRRNELLSFEGDAGEEVRLPPRALTTVIDFTPGVRRCQAIKTAPATLKIRLEVTGGSDEEQVWQKVHTRARDYLSEQGLSSVEVERDPVRPAIDPKTGKFRHVWSEVKEERVRELTW